VDEKYITEVTTLLDRLRVEIAPLRSGHNGSGSGNDLNPTQTLDGLLIKAGSDAYQLGTQLEQRLSTQAKSLSDQMANRAMFVNKFVANMRIFLQETDDTENFNTVSAEKFIPYLPKI
jgi:uncharacterized coiled-coil protein SlyX